MVSMIIQWIMRFWKLKIVKGEKSKEIMGMVESIKKFIKPVNVALCFATTIFCFWLKETNVSIIVGAVLACFLVPRLLASILGVER